MASYNSTAAATPSRPPRHRPVVNPSSSAGTTAELSPLDALLSQAKAFEMPTTSETTGRGHQQERGKENVGNGSWLDFRQSEEHEREVEGEGAAKAARARDVGADPEDEARQVVGRQQQWGADRMQQASSSSAQMPMRGSPHASQASQSTFETATSRAGGGGTEGWTTEDNEGDASPIIPSFPAGATSQRSTSAQSQNPSLSAVAGGVTKPLERWNSTRRYMAQLDPDEETESLADEGGDRATWASDPRDSLAELPAPRRSGLGREGVSKEMTMSSMTMESTGGDPFPYSAYEALPSPSNDGFHADPSAPLPRRPPTITPPPQAISHAQSPSLASNPVVRIGPPSPTTTESFLADPRDSQLWDDGLVSPPPTSPAFALPQPSSPPSSAAVKGRVASQVAPKNFSRPFMAPREQVAPPSRPFRSDSVDSMEGRRQESSLGHGSSLEHSSSIGHSSQGAHSMSRSWEERQEFGMRRHEEERRRVAAAMVASRGGEMEDLREEGRPVDRELDSPAPFTTYDSPSLHAHSLSSAQGSVVYPSPNPPSPHPPHSQHARVPPPLDSQPDGYGFPRRPTTPPLNSPLSNPRVPPPTPPVTSFSQLTRESSYEDRRPRTSEGPDTSPRQRNVLRKPRPEQREPPHTPPVPSPSLSTASPPEHLGPWSRFRSKSKSRVGGSKSSVGSVHHDASNDYRFSNTTDTSTYSQTSSTPTITFQPPSRPIGDLNELAQRARELGEQKRRWEQMQLKPSVARSAQAGFVHAGEANVEPAWLSAGVAASVVGEDGMERLGAGALSAGMMRRTVSDQGPQRLKEDVVNDPSRPPSLYSNYSFYSLPAEDGLGSGSRSPASRQISPNPSPSIGDGSRFAAQQSHSMRGGGGGSDGGQSMGTLQKAKAGLKTAPSRTPSGKRAEPESAEDYLQLGIDYHEAGELQRAAWCFEMSSKKDGGCGAGMLMYGLTLQHGWGCQVNAPLGFRYLQSAAESVVEDLDRVVAGGREMSSNERSTKAAQNELVLALHEIGASFRHGFGVKKDKAMAVAYYTLSADLGDVDAQLDLAFCLANGKGCKKNTKLAAKYYRMAMAQGASSFGLSWAFKDKYMD